MVEGVASSLGPGGDADLVEDVRQVPGNGAVADVELLADLPVGASVGDQCKYLALTPTESVGCFRRGPVRAEPLKRRLRLCEFLRG